MSMTQTMTTRQQLTANLAAAEAFGYTDIAAANRRLLAKLDAKETPVASTEDRIIAAIRSMAAQPNDLVSLARVRAALPDVDHAEMTRTLKAMDRARVIQLDPDPNRKALTDAARSAAVELGGEPKHLVSLV